MEEKKNLLEWLSDFREGKFDSPEVIVQIEAGWYDWFCKNESLKNKTKVLGTKLAQIINSPKLEPKSQFVWFKNCCPMNGTLYDDFRIADRKTGETIFTVVPKSGHKCHSGKGSVWGKENNFRGPLMEGSWKEIKEWFNKK